MSSQSDDDVFIPSSPHIHHSFSFSSPISLNMMKTYQDLSCMDMQVDSKQCSFISLIDDTVNASIRPVKTCTFSTQDNGLNERDMPIPRKQSVLDEKALREDDTKSVRDQRIQTMSRNYRVILESIGEDPSRQGTVSSHLWIVI